MPLYEYACPDCQKDCELLIRGEEQPTCPACGSVKLQKLLSAPVAHLSGSRDLPVCGPMPSAGGCGLPQCGMGGCMDG